MMHLIFTSKGFSTIDTVRNKQITLRIAYVGQSNGTSLHRAKALQRLGHEVQIIDPWKWLGRSKWINRWLYYTGGYGFGLRINKPLLETVTATEPDLIFINQGEFLGPDLLRKLRKLEVPIVSYTNDNPFSERDRKRFYYYRKAIPHYDLLAVSFEENVIHAEKMGARSVRRVWHTADEIAHAPHILNQSTLKKYSSEVTFIGTWMPERGPFMAELIRRGIPLSIWGDRWQKAPEWPVIAPFWCGEGIYNVNKYAAVIQTAKICISLLSKENRNLITRRSIEIPSLGGLLCTERTSEHIELYEEGKEALFWNDEIECAELCKYMLQNDDMRRSIAINGHKRCLKNNLFNESMLKKIIENAINNDNIL